MAKAQVQTAPWQPAQLSKNSIWPRSASCGRARREPSPSQQPYAFTGTTLLKLLREAEKFCLTRQQLDRVDCHMAELRRLAYRQVELVETGQLQGHSVARALKLLAMSNDLMAAYQTLRRRITQRAE